MSRIKGIFFDQDGVIIDTERDGHRVAFNRAFKEHGLNVEWDVDTYQELLQIGGGKERIAHYLRTKGFGVNIPPEEEENFIKTLHKRKTDIFVELISSGTLPLRPGVRRFMEEVNRANLVLGICTTSNERAAEAIVNTMLPTVKFDFVLAGDVVKRKKPDPEIYLLALERSGLSPEECVAIEDSRNGVLAAKGAGLHVIATPTPYTMHEDLSEADLVISCLGDPDGEWAVPIRPPDFPLDGVLRVQQVLEYFS